MKKLFFSIGLLLCSFHTSANMGDAAFEPISSTALANKSIIAFQNFNCATWAEMLGDSKVSREFLIKGYYEGKIYIDGLLAGKISQEDKNRYIPGIMYPRLKFTPNADFMLGAIYSELERGNSFLALDYESKGGNKYSKKAKEYYIKESCAQLLNN